MSSLPPHPDPAASRPSEALFGSRTPAPEPPARTPWLIAAAAVLLALVAVLLLTHRHPAAAGNATLPLDPYAGSLQVGDIVMSESTSLSGGKSTFIDGTVRNRGDRTVTGATVQVLFSNDDRMPPQVETVPLSLIRTREPYVDTQPVSATPIAPGETREFRLIFENIGANWNQSLPEIRAVRITTR